MTMIDERWAQLESWAILDEEAWWNQDLEPTSPDAEAVASSTFEVGLWPKQDEFFRTDERYAALIGGIGSGKSHVGVAHDIVYGLEHPGALIAIIGPTRVNLKQTTLRKFFELLPRSTIRKWNASDLLLTLKDPATSISVPGSVTRAAGGAEYLFLGADAEDTVERMRGLELALFHIDEGPLVPALAFEVLVGRLRQNGYPQRGRVTGTHKGNDWVRHKFEPTDGKASVGPIWHIATRENYSLREIAPDYLPDLESQYGDTEWAVQELLGGHARFEGLIYSDFDPIVQVWRGARPKFDRIVLTFDWGYRYAPVIAIGEWDGGDKRMIAAEWYGRNTTVDQQIGVDSRGDPTGEGALGLVKLLGFEPSDVECYADPARPENIVSAKQKGRGLAFPERRATHVSEGLIECQRWVKRRLHDGTPAFYVHESARWWLAEQEGYQRSVRKGAALDDPTRYLDEPAKGQQDHAMDAWRYGFMGMKDTGYAANALAYLRHVVSSCERCGKPVTWSRGETSRPCPHCGARAERKATT